MKSIYEKQNVRLIPIISHENKYLNKIKAHCNNFAIFAPVEKLKTTENYSIFVEKLKTDEFILYGENSLFVPLLVSIKKQLAKINLDNNDEITVEDLDDLDRTNLELIQKMMKEEEGKKEATTISENDLDDLEEIYHPDSFVQKNQAPEEEDIIETPEITEDEPIEDNSSEEDIEVEQPENEIEEVEEIEEEPEISEEEQEEPQQLEQPEQPLKQAQPQQQPQQIQQEQPSAKVEPKSIDIRTPQQPTNQRPMPRANEIPVYEPKEVNSTNTTDFTEGMRVSHAKYGTGTVEKLIKYGKKTLCSIQFDTLGRRLLDPNITTIEKL